MKKTIMKISGAVLLVALTIMLVSANTKTARPLTDAERMHDAILCYADSFNVPVEFAFNIATLETGYRGPADSTYKPNQVSNKGAMGPMQIMYRYAEYFAGHPVTKEMLRDSIEFNVKLSMKILAKHYKKYKNWRTVAGVYNTGRPIINKYARRAADFKYFQTRWILKEDNYAQN